MAVMIPGLVGVIVFYIVILVIGLWVGRKKSNNSSSDTQFLANRDLGLFVSSLTIAATNVGGAYINGTAESIAKAGLVWTIAPFFYALGNIAAVLIVVPRVRRAKHVTIIDLLQAKYGKKMGCLLVVNEVLGNLFWEAAILSSLGSSLSLILDVNNTIAVIISACIAVVYTFFGGLYSVAYTDVIQLFFITFGLVLAVPFIYSNPAVDLSRVKDSWRGSIPSDMGFVYMDTVFYLLFGAMTWQVYYQRAFACKTTRIAKIATLIGSSISVLLAIPPALIGAAGLAADWNSTSFGGELPLSDEDWSNILPMGLQYLCPIAVSVIGLGAISAAVMSSADSLVLACGSIFARNIYHSVIRPKASEKEIVWVNRISIVVVGALGTLIALTSRSVNGFFLLSGDFPYVIQFPQLACAFLLPEANTYGSLCGLLASYLLRCLGGEPLLHLPAYIKYPYFDEETNTQLFPFKTFAVVCSIFLIVSISYLTNFLFKGKILPLKYDVFKCFEEPPENDDIDDKYVPCNTTSTGF